ncbi:phosphotransferase family protein [Alkalibacillus haloalkaliphilus]|uniref:phosphotransferase family protein n=1 Tax=Alkalibacillus haloalkaliphilus TaxID=94136 RepID=UPI002935BD49|nr:aminoglycoside phosphotransferase family protein [Alkalibacillus haloalkaliphilus]MDV2583220.1 aminoglycoside phosphotransferase family protein [Alkalibacillus haloalkaliphilus]
MKNLGKPIASGNTANIYLSADRVVKVFHEHLADVDPYYEVNKQKFAYACGLPVPKVLDVTKVDGKQAIIMEYLKGKTLGDLLNVNEKDVAYYMNVSIEVQQAIHQIEATEIETMTDKLKRQVKSAYLLSDQQKERLLEQLQSMPSDNKLCHGDFHLYNVMKNNDEMTIIDWVDASSGNPVADACRTYLLYSQASMDLAEMYLQLYCEKSGLNNEEVLDWLPIIAGARLEEKLPKSEEERLLKMVNEMEREK